MGNGPMIIPYCQLHFGMLLARNVATDAPAVAVQPLMHQLINALEGDKGPHFDARAGNPAQGKDPHVVPLGVIPALQNAEREKVPGAEYARRFAEHARDIALQAFDSKDIRELRDVFAIRRYAKVAACLLEAALAVFP